MKNGFVIAALAVANLAAQQAPQVFRGGVNVVEVAVSVLDGNQPVRSLTAKDFSVRDDGAVQRIDEAVAEDVPLAVTIVLDLSGQVTARSKEPEIVAALNDAAGTLRPQDQLRILTIQNSVRQELPWQSGGTVATLSNVEQGWSVLNDGLAAAFVSANGAIPRPVIVTLTAGEDYMGVVSVAHLDALARSSDAVLFAVVPLFRTKVDVSMVQQKFLHEALIKASEDRIAREYTGRNELRDIARMTGGEMFTIDATGTLGSGLARAINAARGSYVLRFEPTDAKKPGWHQLDVRVNRGGYDVRCRRGYMVPSAAK